MLRSKNPTLAYLFRRYLARRLLPSVSAGRFLEIGIGSGDFYQEVESAGFSGLCLDLNPRLIQEHQVRKPPSGGPVRFQSMDFFVLEQTFDLVLAFEVLEHYRDDQACLQKWVNLLNPGGVLIFSVPAHRRQWTSNDTRAGHARRYEKDELTDKLLRQGFRILCLWCYGFPLLNWTYPLSQIFASNKAGDPSRESRSADKVQPNQPAHIDPGQSANISESLMTDFAGTAKSGTRRFDRLSRWIFHEWLWWPFLQIQKPFLNGDLGIGYIVKCSKD